jgi:hypothetical protein
MCTSSNALSSALRKLMYMLSTHTQRPESLCHALMLHTQLTMQVFLQTHCSPWQPTCIGDGLLMLTVSQHPLYSGIGLDLSVMSKRCCWDWWQRCWQHW